MTHDLQVGIVEKFFENYQEKRYEAANEVVWGLELVEGKGLLKKKIIEDIRRGKEVQYILPIKKVLFSWMGGVFEVWRSQSENTGLPNKVSMQMDGFEGDGGG